VNKMVIFFCIPCLMLIAYFGILSIFAPKYRIDFKEAITCFIDKLKGKKCSISFDERMRMKLSAWLIDKGYIKLGKFFNNRRNFNITFTFIFIIFSIVTTYLFILLIQYLFIQSPCNIGDSCAIEV